MDSPQSIVGIYHKDCSGNDGQTAAAVLLRKFPQTKVFPLNHAYAPEEIAPILEAIAPGTTVYTVDIAVAIEECLARGAKVVTIDHHESRTEDLKALAASNPNFTYIFDNDKCGSS